MKKIIYQKPDGSVEVIHPSPRELMVNVPDAIKNLTDDEYVEYVKQKDVPSDASNVTIVDESDIPMSRANRNFWKIQNGKVVVDEAKVEEKRQKESEKQAKRSAIFSKLKISEDELKELLNG